MEIEKYINTLKKESDKLIDNFKEKLTHIPLGKASPELLNNIKVMYQGKSHFISEIATIEAINEIELLIKPNDISALKPIEKTLINSGLDIEVETYENNIIVTYFMLKEIRSKLIEEVDKHLTEFKLNFNDHKQDLIKKIKSDNSINLDEKQLNQNLSLLTKESKAILSHVNSLMLQKNRKQRLTPIQKEINKVKKISMNWKTSPLEDDKILEVRNLHVSFPAGRNKTIHIIRGIDLDVYKGQIIGLVGESGSGKSVTSKTLINVNENGIVTADKIQIKNWELSKIKKEKYWQYVRGSKIGYIPQDPLTSLNPTRTIGKQLLDALNNNNDWKERPFTEKKEYLISLLKQFGLRDAEKIFLAYPHTLSGGMKQRIVITMVVALKPDLIIADEPTTALDPTVQASVLALFEDIRQKMGISIILISHNISVIAKFCDYIYVMYAGKIIECGTKKEIFTAPAHPYTWALISAIPENKDEKLYNIQGTPPDMANLPLGDPFAPRNEYAIEIDFLKEPPLIQITKTHSAATWLLHPKAPKITLSEQLNKRLLAFKKAFENGNN